MVHELSFYYLSPFDRLRNQRFWSGTVVAHHADHENQIHIYLLAQFADVLGDIHQDRRAAASGRFSQGQPVGRHRQNQTGRTGAFSRGTHGDCRWLGIGSAGFQ